MKLSIIFSFRDRETTRVKRCLDSLGKQTFKDFEVLFVDYGSEPNFATKTKALVEQYDFCEYIYTASIGMPWNRSRALNTGARRSTADYLMTTDVDMIYPKDFLEIMLRHAETNKVLHILHYHLPKGFKDWNNLHKYQNLPIADNALGACHLISRQRFFELQGFDELYCYWGIEDRDLNVREKTMGLEVHFLNDKTYMHHQWHPFANKSTVGFMPDGLWLRLETHFHTQKNKIQRNDENWGTVITDRPIFNFVDIEKQQLKNTEKIHWFTKPVTKYSSLTFMMEAFFKMPSGHVLAIDNANYPRSNRFIYWFLNNWNAVMRLTKLGYEFTSTNNEIHNNLYPFITDSNQVEDYFLNFPIKNGVALLMKK
ncbi:MAG: glycosyltransferase family 2 protein [Saprospiraceae bacterium]